MQRAQRYDLLNLNPLLDWAQVRGYITSTALTARMLAQIFLTHPPTMKRNAQVLAFTALLTALSAQLGAGARIKAEDTITITYSICPTAFTSTTTLPGTITLCPGRTAMRTELLLFSFSSGPPSSRPSPQPNQSSQSSPPPHPSPPCAIKWNFSEQVGDRINGLFSLIESGLQLLKGRAFANIGAVLALIHNKAYRASVTFIMWLCWVLVGLPILSSMTRENPGSWRVTPYLEGSFLTVIGFAPYLITSGERHLQNAKARLGQSCLNQAARTAKNDLRVPALRERKKRPSTVAGANPIQHLLSIPGGKKEALKML